jgi:hypothetical protein
VDESFKFVELPIPDGWEGAVDVLLLWRAVLDQAIEDAIEDPEHNVNYFKNIRTPIEEYNEYEAGFTTVCDMAQLDTSYAQNKARQLLSLKGIKW